MCGIAAQFAYHPDAPGVTEERLLRVRDRMTPRGPDAAGLFLSPDRRVGLAHRRLAIIDLSPEGVQPMTDPEHGLTIVFNGEIYNYRALREQLRQDGYRFRSHSDTEVLLGLYARKGAAMVDDLRGMYAFAIWDSRNRSLFLARDPFGIKPLYYADDGRCFRLASQVKALLASGDLDTAPEPAGHVGFFLWGHVPEPYTLHRGIRALPAGTSLLVDSTGRQTMTHHGGVRDLLRQAEEAPAGTAGAEEVRLRLREALLDSVRHHLEADVPVGVFLSAGIDSATLVAFMREAMAGDLRSVTLGFEEYRGTPNDETVLAEAVARQYGTRHETVWVRGSHFRDDAAALFHAMDQPTIDGVNSYFVSKVTAAAGLKVAVSGLGGDELFGSYPSFRQVPRMATLAPLPPLSSLGRGFRAVSAPLLKRFTSPKYAGILEYGGSYGGAYLLRRGMFMPWELPGLLDGEMVREGLRELDTLVRLEDTIAGLRRPHHRVTALECSWYMRNQLLRDADWSSMAHSLEVRVPLVDPVLFRRVAPLLGLPGSPDKRTVATLPVPPLPEAVRNRPKTGFCVPVRQWLLADGEHAAQRGLRGWARVVYETATGHRLPHPSPEGRP